MDQHDIALEVVSVAPQGEWRNPGIGWGLLHLRQGGGIFHGQTGVHQVKTGEGLLLPSGVRGTLRAGAETSLSGVHFQFYPEYLGGILTLPERLLFLRAANRSECVWVLQTDSLLLRRLESFPLNGSSGNSLEFRCELLRLIGPLLAELQRVVAAIHGGQTEAGARVKEVMGHIRDEDLLTLPVGELAHRCGISRRHLSRLVHEQFGCSILALKTKVRLERAAVLLRDPMAKIINVALECGFNHLGSFTAKFRGRFGSTPARWRAEGVDQPQAFDPPGNGEASLSKHSKDHAPASLAPALPSTPSPTKALGGNGARPASSPGRARTPVATGRNTR